MTTGDVIRYYTRSVNIFGGNQQRIRVQNTVFEYFKYFSSRVMLNYIFMAWKLRKRLEVWNYFCSFRFYDPYSEEKKNI